jgi:predicted RNA-binding Zn-ribbon protein involved in translation (DUF1610 family)
VFRTVSDISHGCGAALSLRFVEKPGLIWTSRGTDFFFDHSKVMALVSPTARKWPQFRGKLWGSAGGSAMSALVFTCPNSGRDIVSGINTDTESLSHVQELPVSLFCPHCGKVHRLSAKNGRLADMLPLAKSAFSVRTTRAVRL